MRYSQNLEQDYILDFFSYKTTPGRFIDIGAYDIERFSNTRALYLAGWGGVFVEPQPANYKAISEHYANDEKIKVLNFAVGEPAGEIDFYESDGDAVGTTDEGHMTKWGNAGVKYTKIKVKQVGVAEFFNEYCKDVDFVSIDTEATNMAVFRSIPNFVWEQIQLLCIEHDGGIQEIEDKLTPYGFFTLYTNGENIIMGK